MISYTGLFNGGQTLAYLVLFILLSNVCILQYSPMQLSQLPCGELSLANGTRFLFRD